MSDTMLHGVLCMPPELWQDTELDKRQRYSRYLAASRRIEDDEREIARLREALATIKARVCGEAMPNWENTPSTGDSRGWIADVCDIALGLTPNVDVTGGRRSSGAQKC